MTVVINGTTGYSGPVGVLGDLTTTGNTILGDQSTDTLNVANGNLVLNSSGNLGLGVTPSAWNSAYKAIDVGNSLSLLGGSSAADFYGNAFVNSSGGFIYRTSAAATAYSMATGAFRWYVAPSGTAGNAITFTQAMTLTAAGRLGIGTTSPNEVLDVAGNINASDNIQLTSNRYIYSSNGGSLGSVRSGFLLDGGSQTLSFLTATTERARIDSSGNLGLGVTPSAWFSSSKALQIGASASLSDLSGSYTLLGQNYKTGTAGQDVYLTTGAASLYSQSGGAHRWYAAASGTAGANMTLAQTMTLDSSGRLTTIYQPSFSAYGPISIGVGNIVRYTDTRSNVGGHYNTSTGVFTAPIAGVYFFTFNALMNVNGDYVRLLFRWNGTASTVYGDTLAGGTTTAWAGWSYISIGMSWVISLGAGDTMSIWNDGPSTTYGGSYGTFSGYMLG